VDSSVFDLAQCTLGARVAGTGGLAQEVVADAAVPGIAALATHQQAQAALCRDHAFTGRLLEQTPGEMLDIGVIANARVIQQPQGDFQGEALGWGNTRRIVGNRG